MKTLSIDLGPRSYDIHIAPGLLDRAGEEIKKVCPKAKRLAIVTDANVEPLYSARVEDSLEAAGFDTGLFTGPAGEGAKCATHLAALWEAMMEFGLTRTDAVVALGGGVVGDLAGFAAATILRGVDFIQIPTTLLAQVDSSVGGKVAIDLAHGKNLAGAFWQPKVVLMDPETLNTLDDKTFSDGMAEVVKYGCISDREFFDFLVSHPSRPEIMANIEHVLYTCCDIKRSVVEEDERDTGRRMILNFGHTIGHAYELAGHYEEWTHGQAVAAGMCAALRLGLDLGVMDSDDGIQALTDLLKALGLPTQIDCPWETLVKAIGLDKKSEGSDITMIFLKKMGQALPTKMSKDAVLKHLQAIYGR
ncbi:MAG: 3-dehydroquinate synthase [Oscillospiraceae bacterium]|nr:3-dehydroquinate synthase [Oscillospiraceae bacterium]